MHGPECVCACCIEDSGRYWDERMCPCGEGCVDPQKCADQQYAESLVYEEQEQIRGAA